MGKYAKQKTRELWEGLRWNVIVEIIALAAAVLAIIVDPFSLRDTHPVLYTVVSLSTFVIAVLIYIGIHHIYHGVKAKIHINDVSLDIEFSTKPGRPPQWGRFLAIIIHNNSYNEIKFYPVVPHKIKQVSGKKKWIPPERLKSKDPFLWGSNMGDRDAENYNVKKNGYVIVDILATEVGNTAKLIHLQQRQSGDIVAMPVGTYQLELIVTGEHFGYQFQLPVKFKITYEGGMNIKDIKPIGKHSSYIKKIILFQDNKTVFEKVNAT